MKTASGMTIDDMANLAKLAVRILYDTNAVVMRDRIVFAEDLPISPDEFSALTRCHAIGVLGVQAKQEVDTDPPDC
jgi:hypothetical protein